MPYLLRPRLHFAGRFEADPSTINNSAENFGSATGTKIETSWNPKGTGRFRLLDCKITRICYSDGSNAATDSRELSIQLADAGDRVAAKIVDLDTMQQMASMIWGLRVRLLQNGRETISGRFVPAAFMDLWNRTQSQAGDIGMSAFYQSVLIDLKWSDVSGSRILQELRNAATASGQLSVKFNVDGYNMDGNSPKFATGRVVGTIGPSAASDPRHFVLGRQLLAKSSGANPAIAYIDAVRKKIVVDFGNSTATTSPGGPLADIGALRIHSADQDIDVIQGYTASGFYEETAGVLDLPRDGPLSDAAIVSLASAPLTLTATKNGQTFTLCAEAADGIYVRADDFVYRISPGETATCKMYATRFGAPLAAIPLRCALDDSILQPSANLPVQTPADGLAFEQSITTNAQGVALLEIVGRDPGRPRMAIEGQVYAIRPAAEQGGETKQPDCISILLWSGFAQPAEPSWFEHVQPILQQYAVLYPTMKSVLDLGSYDDVVAKRELLRLVFSLPFDDPNYMPVTRDLSPAKNELILKWLTTSGNRGWPNLGDAVTTRAQGQADVRPADVVQHEEPGGKTEARQRQIGRSKL